MERAIEEDGGRMEGAMGGAVKQWRDNEGMEVLWRGRKGMMGSWRR